jgi:hypothetical protein
MWLTTCRMPDFQVLKTKDFIAAPQAEMLGLRVNVMFSAQANILFQP